MSCAAILERDIGVACSFGILWSDPWCVIKYVRLGCSAFTLSEEV
jgi:hypothetical protein